MHDLIDAIFVKALGKERLDAEHDGATISPGSDRLAITTDSYVVDPLFFPGGDIGSLAVYGTINDLAMCGARPLYLSAGFILEEGLSTEALWRIAVSMRQAADAGGVRIVTGDTKVVDRGRGHGVYINTAGVGAIEHNLIIGPKSIREGDAVVLSGDIGRHGIAVMAKREELALESTIESDCAPLAESVMELFASGIDVHCLRDLTRGGLATALVEIGRSSGFGICVDETAIAAPDEVRGACELLGFDPLYVANEGRYIAFVPQTQAEKTVKIIRSTRPNGRAEIIGLVGEKRQIGRVTMRSRIGSERILDMLSGEQLPRIC